MVDSQRCNEPNQRCTVLAVENESRKEVALSSRVPKISTGDRRHALTQIANVLNEVLVGVRELASREDPDAVDRDEPVDETLVVERLIRQRRLRSNLFPDEWFSDPAWDVLLFLFVSHLKGSRVTVGDVGYGTSNHPSTTIRWIDIIHGAGLIDRVRSEEDARRVYISLTVRGVEMMRQYVNLAI
jgi:DNA-binding MarR family transcriptional regulator